MFCVLYPFVTYLLTLPHSPREWPVPEQPLSASCLEAVSICTVHDEYVNRMAD
jgi:hypothetical protein